MKRWHPQREYSKQELGELHVDRGYINSPVVDAIIKDRGQVVCRPWVPHDDRLFTKRHFTINRRDRTITCPAGKTERFTTSTAGRAAGAPLTARRARRRASSAPAACR